eukprot:jgi/Mesvir1/25655/Mv01872-RA.2
MRQRSTLDTLRSLVKGTIFPHEIEVLYTFLGAVLGTPAGGEFLAAINAAREVGAEVVCGDRDLKVTLARLGAAFNRQGSQGKPCPAGRVPDHRQLYHGGTTLDRAGGVDGGGTADLSGGESEKDDFSAPKVGGSRRREGRRISISSDNVKNISNNDSTSHQASITSKDRVTLRDDVSSGHEHRETSDDVRVPESGLGDAAPLLDGDDLGDGLSTSGGQDEGELFDEGLEQGAKGLDKGRGGGGSSDASGSSNSRGAGGGRDAGGSRDAGGDGGGDGLSDGSDWGEGDGDGGLFDGAMDDPEEPEERGTKRPRAAGGSSLDEPRPSRSPLPDRDAGDLGTDGTPPRGWGHTQPGRDGEARPPRRSSQPASTQQVDSEQEGQHKASAQDGGRQHGARDSGGQERTGGGGSNVYIRLGRSGGIPSRGDLADMAHEAGCEDPEGVVAAAKRVLMCGLRGIDISVDDLLALRKCGRKVVDSSRDMATRPVSRTTGAPASRHGTTSRVGGAVADDDLGSDNFRDRAGDDENGTMLSSSARGGRAAEEGLSTKGAKSDKRGDEDQEPSPEDQASPVKQVLREFPVLHQVLVHERDLILAQNLQLAGPHKPFGSSGDAGDLRMGDFSRPYKVVGVVGAGHLAGIQRLWGEACRKDNLELATREYLKMPDPAQTKSMHDKKFKIHLPSVALMGAVGAAIYFRPRWVAKAAGIGVFFTSGSLAGLCFTLATAERTLGNISAAFHEKLDNE